MSCERKIEKGIPIPPLARKSGEFRKILEPMEVGDSYLFVPDGTWEEHKVRQSVYQYGFNHKKKFTVRKMADGLRAWRIK